MLTKSLTAKIKKSLDLRTYYSRAELSSPPLFFFFRRVTYTHTHTYIYYFIIYYFSQSHLSLSGYFVCMCHCCPLLQGTRSPSLALSEAGGLPSAGLEAMLWGQRMWLLLSAMEILSSCNFPVRFRVRRSLSKWDWQGLPAAGLFHLFSPYRDFPVEKWLPAGVWHVEICVLQTKLFLTQAEACLELNHWSQ